MEAVQLLNGVEVDFEKNRAGLAPVLIQVMNGSFAGGIEKVVFEISEPRKNTRAAFGMKRLSKPRSGKSLTQNGGISVTKILYGIAAEIFSVLNKIGDNVHGSENLMKQALFQETNG